MEKETQDSSNKTSKARYSFFEWMEAFITSIVIVMLLFTFVFRVANVVGSSMENTILDGDKVILTDFLYTPDNGDIVVIQEAQNYKKPIIKRVIAKAGQTLNINFSTGDVVVDGKLLNEPYIKNLTTNDEGGEIPSVIPEGYVFVMGDNRNGSKDSRSAQIGLIDVRNVIGKAQVIVYPPDRMRGLYG